MHLQKKYDPDLGFTTVKGMSRAEAAKASAGVKLVKSDDERAADFARFLIAQALGKGNLALAHSIGESRYAANSNVVSALRSAVAAGTTTGESWAEPLSDYRNLASEFIEWLRPQTILGRFGKNGIPSLRQVPFNVKIHRQLSGGKASFVAEGHAKPVTKFDFGTITLGHAKIATIAVITEELARFSAPSAEALIRDQLAAALIEEMDRSFIDPLRAAVANISPASVTYGVDPVESSGTDADAVRQDVKAVLSRYIAANVTPSSAVWVMPTLTALSLSLMT
ncbi:MAG: phage major capsid protein, partial [Coleofasciculus sp. C2-GNP5-27]